MRQTALRLQKSIGYDRASNSPRKRSPTKITSGLTSQNLRNRPLLRRGYGGQESGRTLIPNFAEATLGRLNFAKATQGRRTADPLHVRRVGGKSADVRRRLMLSIPSDNRRSVDSADVRLFLPLCVELATVWPHTQISASRIPPCSRLSTKTLAWTRLIG